MMSTHPNASVSSKPDRSHERPQRIRTFSLPGGRVFAKLSLSGGQGFELKNLPNALSKMQKLLGWFKK